MELFCDQYILFVTTFEYHRVPTAQSNFIIRFLSLVQELFTMFLDLYPESLHFFVHHASNRY